MARHYWGDVPNFGFKREAELEAAWNAATEAYLESGANALPEAPMSANPAPNKNHMKFECAQDNGEREGFKAEIVRMINQYRTKSQTIFAESQTISQKDMFKPADTISPDAWNVTKWPGVFKSMATDLGKFNQLPGESDHDRIRYVFSNYRWVPVLCVWLMFVVLVVLLRCGTMAVLISE